VTRAARACFYKRLVEAAGRIADKSLASEYRALLLQRFFEDRRGTRNKPGAKPAQPFQRTSVPGGAAEANLRRIRIMTAGLLACPAMFPDVEEAFSRLELPPACDRLRTALHHFAADGKPLDTDTLFTHLHELGLAEEARLIEAVAAQDYRPDPDLSPGQAAQDWWSWYSLMDFSIDALRQQRDEQQLFWANHPDDPAAWARLVKYNELLAQAQTGEYGQDP
jgi:DNA primase